MSQMRTTKIYGNCQVFGPDGKLMFRCLEKRANWYLKRNLAVVINEDPLSIKLNFTPKGSGESVDVLKLERKNLCVVCGIEDLEVLTKHHLVPFVYRQHFPSERKAHSSLFVVPICSDCHYVYENEHANQLKKVLSEAYSAPFNGNFDIERNKTMGIIRCLTSFADKIPQDRQEFLRDKLKQDLSDFGIPTDEDLTNFDVLYNINEQLKKESKKKVTYSHGKTVVERVKDLDEFERMWARHFIDNMSPEYMPEYFLKALYSSAL